MTDTPMTVAVPVRIPIYIRATDGDFVEVGVIEENLDVTIAPRAVPTEIPGF